MLLSSEAASTLVAQLTKEMRTLAENWELNHTAWSRITAGADDPLDWAALGYTLHAVYTSMANYFLRISKAFENDLPSDSWHRELIDRMQLDIPGIRPALLDRATARLVDELRAFRHVFRTLYDERLDPERVALLQRRMPATRVGFSQAHEAFVAKILTIVDADDPDE